MGTGYGIHRTAAVKGVPEDKRWCAAKVLEVVGVPWDPTPNIDAEDGARLPNPDAVEAEVVPRDPEVPESIARRMNVYQESRCHQIWRDGWVPRMQDDDVWQTPPVAHPCMQGEDRGATARNR